MSLLLLFGGGAAAATTAESVSALTLGGEYLIEATYHEGGQTIVIMDLDQTVVETVTLGLTASTYSFERLGLLDDISGGGGVTTGNLDVENFDTSSTGAVSSSNKGTADAVSGSGALTVSTSQFITGAKSLRISTGTAYHQYRYDHSSHSNHFAKFYIRRHTTPGSDMYIWQVYAADNTTIAAQFGVDSTGHGFVRDSNSGTKRATTAVLTVDTWFKVTIQCDGAGGITAAYYSSAAGYTTLVETFAAATTLTATNFGKENLGQLASVSSACDIYIDSFETDDTAMPETSGGGGPVTAYLERIITDSASMPDPLDIGTTGSFSETCVPTTGVLVGVTAAPAGVNGSTTTAGLASWTTVCGRPHMVGIYKSGSWNGVLSSAERAYFDPVGGVHAIPLIHMKFNAGGLTWQQVAAGSADPQIDQVATNLATYGHKFFFTIHHEPEDDVTGTSYSAANFVLMWQHVVTRMRNILGGPAASGGKMVTFLQYVGYSQWAGTVSGTTATGFDNLDPGESYVDWYGWDPYLYNKNSRDTFDELVKENVAATANWTTVGMYNYLVAQHPTKPLMIPETGINIGTIATYPSLVNAGFSDANAAAVVDDYRVSMADYPNIKAFVYWSSQTTNGVYQPYSPDAGALFKAAFASLTADSYFTQDMTVAP